MHRFLKNNTESKMNGTLFKNSIIRFKRKLLINTPMIFIYELKFYLILTLTCIAEKVLQFRVNLELTIIHIHLYTICSLHNSPCNDTAPFVCRVDCSCGSWRFSSLSINCISSSGTVVHLLGSVGSVNETCKLNKIAVQIYSQSFWNKTRCAE